MAQFRILDFYEFASSKLQNDKWFDFWGEGVVQNMEVTENIPPSLSVVIQAGSSEPLIGKWTREGVVVKEDFPIVLPLPLPNTHPTWDRIDYVVATYHWASYAIGSGTPPVGYYQWAVGVPAASPVPPAIPAYSIPLATVRVRPGATAIYDSDINDDRHWVGWNNIIPIVEELDGIRGNYFTLDKDLDQTLVDKCLVFDATPGAVRKLCWMPSEGYFNFNDRLSVDGDLLLGVPGPGVPTDIHLYFGTSENIKWDAGQSAFVVSDDLKTQDNLSVGLGGYGYPFYTYKLGTEGFAFNTQYFLEYGDYTVGSNNLMVFANGFRKMIANDYSEVSGGQYIDFLYQRSDTDSIELFVTHSGSLLYEFQLGSEGDVTKTIYTLTSGSYTIGNHTLLVWVNGQKQSEDEYTETSTTSITFDNARNNTDKITFQVLPVLDYSIQSGSSGSGAGNRVFTLPFTYNIGFDQLLIFRGTKKVVLNAEYTETGTSEVTFQYDIDALERIEFYLLSTTKNSSNSRLYWRDDPYMEWQPSNRMIYLSDAGFTIERSTSEEKLVLSDGTSYVSILKGDNNPSLVATAGTRGSLYIGETNPPGLWQKQDYGTTTNWVQTGMAAVIDRVEYLGSAADDAPVGYTEFSLSTGKTISDMASGTDLLVFVNGQLKTKLNGDFTIPDNNTIKFAVNRSLTDYIVIVLLSIQGSAPGGGGTGGQGFTDITKLNGIQAQDYPTNTIYRSNTAFLLTGMNLWVTVNGISKHFLTGDFNIVSTVDIQFTTPAADTDVIMIYVL